MATTHASLQRAQQHVATDSSRTSSSAWTPSPLEQLVPVAARKRTVSRKKLKMPVANGESSGAGGMAATGSTTMSLLRSTMMARRSRLADTPPAQLAQETTTVCPAPAQLHHLRLVQAEAHLAAAIMRMRSTPPRTPVTTSTNAMTSDVSSSARVSDTSEVELVDLQDRGGVMHPIVVSPGVEHALVQRQLVVNRNLSSSRGSHAARPVLDAAALSAVTLLHPATPGEAPSSSSASHVLAAFGMTTTPAPLLLARQQLAATDSSTTSAGWTPSPQEKLVQDAARKRAVSRKNQQIPARGGENSWPDGAEAARNKTSSVLRDTITARRIRLADTPQATATVQHHDIRHSPAQRLVLPIPSEAGLLHVDDGGTALHSRIVSVGNQQEVVDAASVEAPSHARRGTPYLRATTQGGSHITMNNRKPGYTTRRRQTVKPEWNASVNSGARDVLSYMPLDQSQHIVAGENEQNRTADLKLYRQFKCYLEFIDGHGRHRYYLSLMKQLLELSVQGQRVLRPKDFLTVVEKSDANQFQKVLKAMKLKLKKCSFPAEGRSYPIIRRGPCGDYYMFTDEMLGVGRGLHLSSSAASCY